MVVPHTRATTDWLPRDEEGYRAGRLLGVGTSREGGGVQQIKGVVAYAEGQPDSLGTVPVPDGMQGES